MSFDLYADLAQNRIGAVNCATEIDRLTVQAVRKSKQDALESYLRLIHSKNSNRPSQYTLEIIGPELDRLDRLGLRKPIPPDVEILPYGSAFLQFDFTLSVPFFTKDDTQFYVTDAVNPLRKDKVFRVPLMAASSWKGLLRWTLTQILLVERKDSLGADEFAQERFGLTRLFGDEKGEGADQTDDLAGFLDNLKPDARERFRALVKTYFSLSPKQAMPQFRGRLMCYPTFFDRIDVEVINPHRRETKAGTQPIYLECTSKGATGTFTLLYVPVDRIGQGKSATSVELARHLAVLAQGLQAMFTIYGFGAKTSSGFGLARNGVHDGMLRLNLPDQTGRTPRPVKPEQADQSSPPPQTVHTFSSFDQLVTAANHLVARLNPQNGGAP